MNASAVASMVVCIAAVVVTIATALSAAFRSRHAQVLAPICRALGFGVVTLFLLWTSFDAARLVGTPSAEAPLGQADRQRRMSNFIAELMYDALFTTILAAPAFVAARYARRRAAGRSRQ